MKFDKIVAFGDSWVWGDELLDPALINHEHAHPVLIENTQYRESHAFLGQLGQHYGVPTENFGWPGGSLQSAIWCYLWWWEHETLPRDRCLVLVGHTEASRQSFYNPQHVSYANDPPWNKFLHSSWIHSGNSNIDRAWQKMVQQHMVLTDCDALHRLNYQQSVMFFEGQSHLLDHNLLQFCSILPPCDFRMPTLLWPGQSLGMILDSHPESRRLYAPQGHPNENGHQVIRDALIYEIDRAILAR